MFLFSILESNLYERASQTESRGVIGLQDRRIRERVSCAPAAPSAPSLVRISAYYIVTVCLCNILKCRLCRWTASTSSSFSMSLRRIQHAGRSFASRIPRPLITRRAAGSSTEPTQQQIHKQYCTHCNCIALFTCSRRFLPSTFCPASRTALTRMAETRSNGLR